MAKNPNIKQKQLSIRLKTAFVLQVHLEELDMITETASLLGKTTDGHKEFIDLMVDAMCQSLSILFPKPFDA